jgi:hypothetical protein
LAAVFIDLVPVTAVFIARFSYGYTLRSILLAVLALPALLAIGLFSAAHFHYHLHVHTPARIAELAAIVGFVLLISLIARKRYFPMVCLIYLPKSKHIKKRNSETFHFRIKQTASIFFYFFLPAGTFVTTLFLSFIILPAIWITLAVCIRFLMLLFRFRRATDL